VARVLLICPAVPAPAGVGLAMRAGVSVEGLGRHHDLTVAVIRSPFDTTPFGWVRARAGAVFDLVCPTDRQSAMSWIRSERGRRVACHPLPALARQRPPSVGERIIERAGCRFDVVVVMRTYVSGAALALLDAGVPGILDADDDDAGACASLARLDPSWAEQVAHYEAFQREAFPWFERVLFAARDDAVPPFQHLPNAVRIPPTWSMRPVRNPLEVLFVGHPSYLPNRDALDRLRRDILPAIEALGVAVHLLHPGPSDDVSRFYERAHIAVVPLRAGGGTRIKILEAFAHGCPVVSTPTGVRGLAVSDGEHLVITDDDDDDGGFAAAVVGLARDGGRRRRLAEAARAFVTTHHDCRHVGDRLARLVADRAPVQ
jgi:hypothetical protein